MPNLPPIKLTLFGGSKTRANYQLTAKGKIKAEEFSVSGAKGEVIGALENSESPCTVSEIANTARMSPSKVRQIIQVLIRDGWVRKVTSEE